MKCFILYKCYYQSKSITYGTQLSQAKYGTQDNTGYNSRICSFVTELLGVNSKQDFAACAALDFALKKRNGGVMVGGECEVKLCRGVPSN